MSKNAAGRMDTAQRTARTARKHDAERFDLVLVGGGLQNGLIALAVLARKPGLRIAMVEAGARPGGNHTWCMHARDVPDAARPFVDPLVVKRWPGYEVRFPAGARRIAGAYAAITSQRFGERVLEVLHHSPGSRTFLGCRAEYVGAQTVALEDGRMLTADLIVDARGPRRMPGAPSCGYQKFLGLELAFEPAHSLGGPILMDASVEQVDGFRFFYVLPFGPSRMLVEDTRFSLDSHMHAESARRAVLAYASRFGRVQRVLREEHGVLPMPWKNAHEAPCGSPLVAGYRGGWFHPATGYSMPAAIRLALHVADRAPRAVFDEELQRLYRQHERQARYAERLNWLLFHGFEPHDMWRVFERFYRLPDALIHRFYAMQLSFGDRARILLGRPPGGLKLATALATGLSP
jgi:lycopene beta-cyclase